MTPAARPPGYGAMNAILEKIGWEELPKTSLYALLAANLIPLLGVMALGWRVGDIMFLFWLENAIIGVFNIVRMLIATGGGILAFVMKLPTVAFFTVHYGLFTFVHGIIVIVMFVGAPMDGDFAPESAPPAPIIEITEDPDTWPDPHTDEMTDEEFDELLELAWLELWDMLIVSGLWVAVVALVVSHGVSLFINFIRNGEYRNATADSLMMRPYGRVVVLHIVIIFGGMMVMATGQLTAALVLLIVLKVGLDAGAHVAERTHFAKRNAGQAS